MGYRLNAAVQQRDFQRSRSAERSLVADLAERGVLLFIDNVAVDVPNLVQRRFACDTTHCVRLKRRHGRPWFVGSCCTDLAVEITPTERNRLRHLAADYLDLVPDGLRSVRAVARKILADRIVFYSEKDEPILGDCRTNRCILSYLDHRGVLRCAVHTMIEALGRGIESYKLDACICFPLHYVDYEPNQWLLTIVCNENYQRLGTAKAAAHVPCLIRPLRDAPPAYIFLRREIEYLFGVPFWQELDRQAQRILHEPSSQRHR